MALFKSSILAQASGSVAGTTFSHNRAGMYMRSRSTPTNPNSAAQILVRGFFANASQAWRTSPLVHAGWKAYADGTSWVNAVGDAIKLSGQQAFVAYDAFRRLLGLTVVAAAPVTMGRATQTIDGVTLSADNGAEITFSGTNEWTANLGALAVFIGRPVSAGVTFYNGPYTYVGSVPGAAVPPTSPDNTVTPAGIVAGERRFVRVRSMAPDGRTSIDKVFGPITVAA